MPIILVDIMQKAWDGNPDNRPDFGGKYHTQEDEDMTTM
jgi:hypothetical protein